MAWEQPITEFAQDVISPNSLAWTTEEHYSDTWDNRPYQEDIQYNVLAYVRDSTPKGVANYILGDANSDTALYWGINNFGSYQVNLYGVVAGEHMQIATFGNLADQHGWGLNISLALGRDTSTNTYNIITLAERLGSTVYTSYYSQPNGQQGYIRDIVNYAFSVQPISYNWQSVPSISGKNGISQPLSSHLDINDGEPITTSDTTKYSLNNNSNINKLVQDKLNS